MIVKPLGWCLAPAVFLCAASAQTPGPGIGFALMGVTTGQSARLNALNMGSRSSTQDSSCSVQLQFLDAQGVVLKQTLVTLSPGKGTSLDLSRNQVPGAGPRAEIRALVLFGYSGGAPPGSEVLRQFDCNIVPSIEVYDNNTGRTSYILTEGKPLPGPDPRATASAGLAEPRRAQTPELGAK